MEPIELGGIFNNPESEVIVDFCDNCGCPVTMDEIRSHHYAKKGKAKRKMVIDTCVYCTNNREHNLP